MNNLRELLIPLDYETDPETGLNLGRNYIKTPIEFDSALPTLGSRRVYPFGPCPIVLREPNDQVLMHEILHVALDGRVPSSEADPHGHQVITRAEVALWETGYRRTERGDDRG